MNLFQQFYQWGAHLPPAGFYLFIFAWLFIESTGFPISDEPLLLLAGYLTTTGKLQLVLVIIIALVGKVSASYCAYLLGHVFDLERLARPEQVPQPSEKAGDSRQTGWFNRMVGWLYYLRPTRAAVLATEERVRRSGAWGVFFGRLVPVVRSFISYPAGAARMPQPIFLGATAAGSLLWIGGWTVTGSLVGRSYEQLSKRLGVVSIVLVVAAAVGILLLLIWNHRRAEAAALRLQAQRVAEAARQAREHRQHRPASAARPKPVKAVASQAPTAVKTPRAAPRRVKR